MSVYLQLKGKLADLRKKEKGLIIAANSHADGIKEKLAASAISPVREIDADAILYHAEELKQARDGIIRVSEDIRKVRKELGEE